MKKLLLLLLPALTCLSCAKEMMEKDASSQERFTVTASIEGTKLSVDAAGKTFWDDGDEIGIFLNGKIVKCTLADGAGTATGVFSSDVDARGKTVNGVAVYPYDESLTLNGKKLTVMVPSSNKEGYCYPVPMAGKLQADGTYAFRNIAAIFRVKYTNLPSIANTVKVTASNTVSGTFTLNDYETSWLTLPSTTTGTVLWSYLPKRRPDNEAYVDFPMPVGTLSTLKVELLDVENKVIDTKTTSSKTFAAGTVKPMTAINIPGDRMKVEWVWDGGSLPTFRSNIPAIDDNGNVYVATNEGALYKLDNTGRIIWRTALSGMAGKVETSPSVEKDGSTIYMAGGQDNAGTLYALTPDGKIKWTFNDYPWVSIQPSRNYWQTFLGIGTDNLYVPVGTHCTMLAVKKSDGTRVSYGSGTLDGSRSGVDGPGAGCAVGLGGTVSFMSNGGAYTWSKALLDNPSSVNPTYGKFAPWGYRDCWPGWGSFQHDKQGVVATKKGPTFNKDVIISCAQESKGRYDICCYPASFGTENTLTRHDDDQLKYYWRHQIGTNTADADAPAMQDQGGIVMGHENLVVIVPMKYRSGANNPKIGEGGLYSIWVGRTDDGGTTCWRVTTGSNYVSGAAAVDNNGNVHFATDRYYYVVKPNTANGGSYEILNRIDLRNLLLASGYLSNFSYTGVWSSVKIAKGGKIYLNVNISSTRGVTCCFTYPGVTGPDETSSWPQKGADQYNSSTQQL